MIIRKTAERVRFIKRNPRMLPRLDLTGVGQLLQCRPVRSREGMYPGMRRRSKLEPLDITLICRPNDSLDPRPQDSPDAGFTEEALHRVRTHDGLKTLHRVRRDREAQRGVMPKEPHPLIVHQLVVGDDLDAGQQERRQ